MKQLPLLNPEQVSEQEAQTYTTRFAARAVLVDAQGKIPLLYVANEGYYKLPGGGIESSEDKIIALRRECLEEIGCEIDVHGEVGMIVEYRKFAHLLQTSYCYFGTVTAIVQPPAYTKDELRDGFRCEWLPYPDALEKLSHASTTLFEGREYIVPRDTLLLKEAARFIKS